MERYAHGKQRWKKYITPVTLVLLLGTVIAWVVMILQAQSMGSMPGTMGMSLAAFIVMWAIMMAAMMLPSLLPLASRYIQMINRFKWAGLISFIAGYLVVWSTLGILAYLWAWFSNKLVTGIPTLAMIIAVTTYAVCGLYQFSSLKDQCLTKCRAPFSLILEYASWRGSMRHFLVGAHHGIFCLGCCWALMALMIVFGVMNLGAMLILTVIIAIEKLWVTNQTFSQVVGFGCLTLAAAVIWFPQLAPGLISTSRIML